MVDGGALHPGCRDRVEAEARGEILEKEDDQGRGLELGAARSPPVTSTPRLHHRPCLSWPLALLMLHSSLSKTHIILIVLAIALCMPLLPASVTRSAARLASSSARSISIPRPLAGLRASPVATTLSGITLPFALFSSSSASKAKDDMAPGAAPNVQKSESEWQAILSPEQFRVIRQKGTERPGSHKYDHSFDKGVYRA